MNHTNASHVSDLDIVAAVRNGDPELFGELWKRHASAVVAATRSFTNMDPDDVAQETFLNILEQIRAGKGPESTFRTYAIRTARNVATNMARRRSYSEQTGHEESVFESYLPAIPGPETKVVNSLFTGQVFRSLPTRWQEVLWYRDVEGLSIQDSSVFLGISENATSALLKRAREGFKQAWIAANLDPQAGISPDCQWVIEKLPRLTRGKTTASVEKRLTAHLLECTHCAIISEEADQLHKKLAMVLIPFLLGVSAAPGYKAWLQEGAGTLISAELPSAIRDQVGAHAAFIPDPSEFTRLTGPDTVFAKVSSISKAGFKPIATLSVITLTAAVGFTVMPARDDNQSTAPVVITQEETPAEQSQDEESRETEESTVAPEEELLEEPTGTAAGGLNLPEGTIAPATDSGAMDGRADTVDSNEHAGPSTQPTAAAPPPALSATPMDGIESGVFPRLSGVAAPNARIYLTVTNDAGQTYTAELLADGQGRWIHTVSKLLGTVAVTGYQVYNYGGRVVTDEVSALGSYEVGHGLDIQVIPTSGTETTVRISGLGAPSRNHVLTVESTTLGTIAFRQAPSAEGVWETTLPYARSAIGDLRYWKGDTSVGPKRVWWGIAN